MITRRSFLKYSLATAAISPLAMKKTASADPPAPKMPNIIYVLSDDIGYADIAAYRRYLNLPVLVPTPHLDSMVQHGMMFTDAYTPSALCAPTRYGTFTGNFCFRGRKQWGAWSAYEPINMIVGGLKQKTMGDVAKTGGYHTAFFGKLHVGGDFYEIGSNNIYSGDYWNDNNVDVARGYASNGPTDYGFDYTLVLPSGIQGSPYAYYENDQWMKIAPDSTIVENSSGKKKDSNWDASTVGAFLAQKTVDFIDDHLINHSDKPFFIYYCSQAIHTPHYPPDYYDEDLSMPVKGVTGINNHTDMIYELDLQIGEMIAKLRAAGIERDTLVVFTSDNGGWDFADTQAAGHDSNNPLRGMKGEIYEGGSRVPFIAQWADTQTGQYTIAPNSKSNHLTCTIDIMATIYNLTGQPMEAAHACDSVSLLPVFTGKQPDNKPIREFLIMQGRNTGGADRMAIRVGNWKLIINHNNYNPIELTNLKTDLSEANNLVNDPAQQPRVMKMVSLFKQVYNNSACTSPRVAYSTPGCVTNSTLDSDDNCVIDTNDLANFAQNWLSE